MIRYILYMMNTQTNLMSCHNNGIRATHNYTDINRQRQKEAIAHYEAVATEEIDWHTSNVQTHRKNIRLATF